jgi:hypothetical protein
MATTAAAALTILRAMGLRPKIADAIAQWRCKPAKADRDLAVEFCRWLDERRVFQRPMNSEVVEACVSSLGYVRDRAAEFQARVEDNGVRAVLGGLLDVTRRFLDRWEGVSTPRPYPHHPPFERSPHETPDDPGTADLPEFFEDLGELRGNVRTLVSILAACDKRLAKLALLAT